MRVFQWFFSKKVVLFARKKNPLLLRPHLTDILILPSWQKQKSLLSFFPKKRFTKGAMKLHHIICPWRIMKTSVNFDLWRFCFFSQHLMQSKQRDWILCRTTKFSLLFHVTMILAATKNRLKINCWHQNGPDKLARFILLFTKIAE